MPFCVFPQRRKERRSKQKKQEPQPQMTKIFAKFAAKKGLKILVFLEATPALLRIRDDVVGGARERSAAAKQSPTLGGK